MGDVYFLITEENKQKKNMWIKDDFVKSLLIWLDWKYCGFPMHRIVFSGGNLGNIEMMRSHPIWPCDSHTADQCLKATVQPPKIPQECHTHRKLAPGQASRSPHGPWSELITSAKNPVFVPSVTSCLRRRWLSHNHIHSWGQCTGVHTEQLFIELK